jgi:hypothetical protein
MGSTTKSEKLSKRLQSMLDEVIRREDNVDNWKVTIGNSNFQLLINEITIFESHLTEADKTITRIKNLYETIKDWGWEANWHWVKMELEASLQVKKKDIIEKNKMIDIKDSKFVNKLLEIAHQLDEEPKHPDKCEIREYCTAILYHGPGHQSKAHCEKTGKHTIHFVEYGNYQTPCYWKGNEASTGFFDEPENQDELESISNHYNKNKK